MGEGDETRHRISRQSDERRARDNSHRDRTPGLDRHPPQHQRSDAFDARFDMVLFAGRNPAGSENEVVAGSDFLQAGGERSAIIPENTEIADFATQPLEHRHQHEAVGIEQLRRRARAARRYQFIAGRKHRDADAPAHLHMRQAEGGRKRDILRPQALARRQRRRAGRNILARAAHIGAGLEARRQNHPAVGIEAHIFLHEHGVGSVRHRRTGENPHGMAGLERLARQTAGLNASGHGKYRFFR